MNLRENIRIALESIKDNFLRSLLTLLIIAVGIACLVGILTAIDSVLFSMSDNFSRLGANTFSISRSNTEITNNIGGKQRKRGPVITYDDAIEFKERYLFGGTTVSVDTRGNNAAVQYKDQKTAPTINVTGIDNNYFTTAVFDFSAGRSFSPSEQTNGNNVAIIGADLVKDLFSGKEEQAIDKVISVNSNKYRIIGTLASKGSSSGRSDDNVVFIPLLTAKKYYGYSEKEYNIKVAVSDPTLMEEAISRSIGVMRNVRKLKAAEENDFEIRKSDGVMEQLKSMTTSLRMATVVIATLTLLGAAIGLMNIMLVSVTERTKEIGVRKALGATRRTVLIQFLTEAVVICMLGGLLGIILGILMGLGVTLAVKGNFFVPWNWMTLGIIVCIVVGVVSGLYPAIKAARLDPIESLRYE